MVLSLFVNPAQFSDGVRPERLSPRRAARRAARRRGGRRRRLRAVRQRRCTRRDSRPGSTSRSSARSSRAPLGRATSAGVATVCLKLFTIVRPDAAYFGQKDAQQVAVLRQLVRDLALELELRVLPTVRDPDGLALSSRNVRLTPPEREQALRCHGRSRRRIRWRRRACSKASTWTTSPSRRSTPLSSPPPCASATPA